MRIFDSHTHPIWRDTGRTQAADRRLIAHYRKLGITGMNILGNVSLHGWGQNAAQITEINDDSIALALRGAGLSASNRKTIFHGNAVRLVGLNQETLS